MKEPVIGMCLAIMIVGMAIATLAILPKKKDMVRMEEAPKQTNATSRPTTTRPKKSQEGH